jgi:hypothetical protein
MSGVRLSDDLRKAIARGQRAQADHPSFAEAMRRLIMLGLCNNVPADPVPF